MTRSVLTAVAFTLTAGLLRAGDDLVIDTMDAVRFQPPKEKGKAEPVPGKVGGAVRFTFENDCGGAFFSRALRGGPAWDRSAGFSFWVKGDGSKGFGCLQFIYNDDYALRYDYAFPLRSTEWAKVSVRWGDLIPVLPAPGSVMIDPAGGNKPSKLTGLFVGKWWYWRDTAAASFALDDFRVEPVIDPAADPKLPPGPPLARTLAKLKAGRPVTIVTMGDSLADDRHWANREVSWPKLLRKKLRDKYGSEVTIVNPAIGGTQLRQNLVLIPTWVAEHPEPDLVTVCFGANDWDAGMRGPMFLAANRDAIGRIRRATNGASDVLLMTTVPGVNAWTTRAELAESCRTAAREKAAGLADTEKAFLLAGRENKDRLFVHDKVHLGPAGHDLVADTVLDAIKRGGE